MLSTRTGWNSAGDLDPELSARTRTRLLVAERGALLAAGHYPRPGFGWIEVDGEGQRFVPADAEEL
jgi:hypothetical protein